MSLSTGKIRILQAGILVLVAGALRAGTVPSVNLSEILPPELKQSIHHTVEQVDVEDGYYRFLIDSELGTFLADSMAMLRNRVDEIATLSQAMNQFSAQNQELSEELQGQFSIRADSALDILTRPVSTATNLAGQLGEDLNQTFNGSPVVINEREKIDFISLESSDPTLALHRRNIAAQWGLDVYSTNPRVQGFLDTVARARAGGRISAGAPGFFRSSIRRLNVADPDVDAGVASALKSSTAAELRRDTIKRLADMQIPAAVIGRFMDQPGFTPRHRVRIAHYLGELDGVRNRAAFIEVSLRGDSESKALAAEQAVMMLLHYHRNTAAVEQLYDSDGLLVAILSDRRMLYIMPEDILYWDGLLKDRLLESIRHTSTSGFTGRELILAGTITDDARAELERHEVAVHAGYVK